MPDVTEPTKTPTTKSASTSLEEFGKAIPALAVIVVLLSLVYEAAFLWPIGITFLVYYSWQDFLRNAIFSIPALIPLISVPMIASTGLKEVRELWGRKKKLEERIKELEAKIVARGGTLPKESHDRVNYLGAPTSVRLWMFLLSVAGCVYEAFQPSPNIIALMALLVFAMFLILAENNPAGEGDSATLLARTFLQRRAFVGMLLFAALLAAYLGGNDGRNRLAGAEGARVRLRGDRSGVERTMQCNVLRELNNVLLAICDSRVTAINTAFVESVQYERVIDRKE
jgi:hypothetical protein